MADFYKGCGKVMLVCIVLFLSFIFSTAVFDTVAHSMGIYDEGVQDSNALRMGQ